VSLGRISSVISDCVLATVRAARLVSMEFIGDLLHSLTCRSDSAPPGRMKLVGSRRERALGSSFGNRRQIRKSSPGRGIARFEQNG